MWYGSIQKGVVDMDQVKIGQLLSKLRKQRALTQQQLADQLGLSGKAISKWERGQGCPDLSVLPQLSAILGVPMESLLSGSLPNQEANGGNMKNLKFYVCPNCGNLMTSTGAPSLSCCGRVLQPLTWKKPDTEHILTIEEIDGEWFLSSKHSMTKAHSLMFAALVTSERVTLVRQWPEWDFQLRISKRGHGILYWYCTQHGLFRTLI